MGEIIEFPEGQYDPSRRRLEPEIEARREPDGNPELAALKVPSEQRYLLNAKLQRIEKDLSHALSDPAGTSKKWEDSEKVDATSRLFDLDYALSGLESLKSQLPETYHAYATRIVGCANGIRQLYADYRTDHPDHYNPREMVYVHRRLRELDPDHFPLDLVDISDEEFERLGSDGSRSIDARMTPRALLAEYDPDRFRRIFGPKYPPATLERQRQFWEVQGARYLKDWQTIERVLTEIQTR